MKGRKEESQTRRKSRIAVIDRELCNPQSCGLYLCNKVCPVNRSGQDCITVSETDKKPLINEDFCVGCGICCKKCPKGAIEVVNLPGELEEAPVHRYGKNLFALYRLPIPKKKSVTGLIGQNGVGKSTVLKILSGEVKPNSGLFGREQEWESIIERFRGTELQDYLEKLSERKIRAAHKPQQVDLIPKIWKGRVSELLERISQNPEPVVKALGMVGMLDKEITGLSGGELQLLAIAATMLKDADFYFFDEPSSYLDVYQRLSVAREIRRLTEKAVVMVIEHDLAVADYLADYVHILYGKPGVFGVVSNPFSVRVGINTYLEGYIQEENVRFREEAIMFTRTAKSSEKNKPFLDFPGFEKKFHGFSVKTDGGTIHKGEIIGILGPNSTGKTTFIKMLAGILKPDKILNSQNLENKMNELRLSYKPQMLAAGDEDITVEEFIRKSKSELSAEERSLLRNLGVERMFLRRMGSLSGGEMQSAFVSACLLKECDILLMDEPSAFLDVEQRLRVAKVLRSKSESTGIPCFIVDHDLQFIDAISDRVMIFEGTPGKQGHGLKPCELNEGMNKFLKNVGITFRRDPQTGRPRANKPGSQKDVEQKESGKYYYS